VEAGGRNKKGAGVVREEEGPGGGHHGPRFFAFSGHPRGRATEGEFATNAAGGWGEGHAARNRMTPAHPPLRGCKNSVRMDFASDRARYLLLPRTSRVGQQSCLRSGQFFVCPSLPIKSIFNCLMFVLYCCVNDYLTQQYTLAKDTLRK
jgi:hypothetical protein